MLAVLGGCFGVTLGVFVILLLCPYIIFILPIIGIIEGVWYLYDKESFYNFWKTPDKK